MLSMSNITFSNEDKFTSSTLAYNFINHLKDIGIVHRIKSILFKMTFNIPDAPLQEMLKQHSAQLSKLAALQYFPTATRSDWNTIVKGLLLPTVLSEGDYFIRNMLRNDSKILTDELETLNRIEQGFSKINIASNMEGLELLYAAYSVTKELTETILLFLEKKPCGISSIETWKCFRKVLIDQLPYLIPILAAMYMLEDGIANYCCPTLFVINKDGTTNFVTRENLDITSSSQEPDTSISLENIGAILPESLNFFSIKISAHLLDPLYNLLSQEPVEIGWKKWWSDIFFLRTAFNVCMNVNEDIAQRLLPMQKRKKTI